MENRKINFYAVFGDSSIKMFDSLQSALRTRCIFVIEENIGYYENLGYKNRDIKFKFYDKNNCESYSINIGNWTLSDVGNSADHYYQRTTLSLRIADPEGEIKKMEFPNFNTNKERFLKFIFGIERLGNWDQVAIYEENERLKSEIESLEWQLKSKE